MNEDLDMQTMLTSVIEGYSNMVKVGMAAGEGRYVAAIAALDAAYRKAMLDPQTKLPSYLDAAINMLLLTRRPE
jgi:hypothetical protein